MSWLVLGTAAKIAGRPATLSPVADESTVLAVDVDGVISLFGFEGRSTRSAASFHLIDGIAHCISDAAGTAAARGSPRSTS